MKRAAALLALCSCNQVFGLEETDVIDAAPHQFFDAMPDAPFACPPVGTVPAFSSLLHQVIHQECNNYAFARTRDLAVASCNPGAGQLFVGTGPIDGLLDPAPGLVAPNTNTSMLSPRITPETDRVFVTATNNSNMTARAMVFGQQGTAWVSMPDFAAVSWSEFPSFVGVTSKPTPHVLFIRNYQLYEFIENTSGGWTPLPVYSFAELGVVPYAGSVTEDGLRLIFSGSTGQPNGGGVYYTDRPDLGSRFGKATLVDTVPIQVQDPFMTTDCSRLYFSGFGSVFYVQQQ